MNEPIGIATVLAEITRRFEAAAPKNLSGGVEIPQTRNVTSTSGMGIGDLGSAASMPTNTVPSGSCDPPAQNLLPSPSDQKDSSAVPVDLNVEAQNNLPVPALAEVEEKPRESESLPVAAGDSATDQARESDNTTVAPEESRGGQKLSSEGPEPEELDSFYDRLGTDGLELQAPTFDPDLYD